MHMVTNTVASFESLLNDVARKASFIWIASAFVNDYAITLLKTWMRVPPRKRPQVRMVTGLYHYFNRKKCLKDLQRLSRRYDGYLDVRISRNPSFHWKFYLFRTKNGWSSFIGSANFTETGLSSDGELLLMLNLTDAAAQKANLPKVFQKEFEDAKKIGEIDFGDYHELQLPKKSGHPGASLSKLLGPKKKAKEDPSLKFCRITKVLGKLTVTEVKQVLEAQSGWDKHNWDFYCTNTRQNWMYTAQSKYILMFYSEKGRHFAVLLLRRDQAVTPTAHGKYFIAYTPASEPLRISEKIGEQFMETGMNYKKRERNFKETFANQRQRKMIEQFFRL